MIPDGSIVTYQGLWTRSGNLFGGTAAEFVASVSNDLNAVGLAIRNSNYQANLLGGFPSSGLPVTLSLQVENGLGFNTPDDIIAVIRHAVYQEAGEFPVSDAIPLVQVPGGTATPTGQPSSPGGQPDNQPGGCIAGTSDDLSGSFSLSCWFSNLTTKGLSTVGLLAIFVVLGIALLVFVPHKAST